MEHWALHLAAVTTERKNGLACGLLVWTRDLLWKVSGIKTFLRPNPISVWLLWQGRAAPSPGLPSSQPSPRLCPGRGGKASGWDLVLSSAVSWLGHCHSWFSLPGAFGQCSKAEKGAGEKWSFIPWGRDQAKVLSHGPVPTAAPQGGRSPQAPPSDVSPGGFPPILEAQLSPQEPGVLISPPFPPFVAEFSYVFPITCPDSWLCQNPPPAVSGSGCAKDAPGLHQGWGVE